MQQSVRDGDDDDEYEEPGGGGSASDEDEAGGDDAYTGGEEVYGEDEEYARRLDREMNGPRPSRTSRAPAPSGGRAGGGSGAGGGARSSGGRAARRKSAARTSGRSVARVSYAESDDSDDSEGGGRRSAAARARQEPLPAFEEGENFDDEVERVLAHREMAAPEEGAEGLGADPSDPWTRRELYIKWKRYSYIHCSWDTKATLSQLAGFKRVLNYIKRVGLEERRGWDGED